MANLRANKITSTEVFETTGSVQFDGSGDYLSLADSNDWNYSTGDFTVEFWYYFNSLPDSDGQFFYSQRVDGGNYNFIFATNTKWEFDSYESSSQGPKLTFTTAHNLSTWNHLAVTRSGNTFRLFVNGVESAIQTNSDNLPDLSAVLEIGRWTGGPSRYVTGHISNFRILKGTALYTKNFTPPTRELTVIPNTVLLACTSTTNTAQEATGKTITVNGNAVANELTPGLLTDVVKSGGTSAITGSVEFGESDYLSLASSSDFNLGTGDFTIEFWIHPQKRFTSYPTIFQINATNAANVLVINFRNTSTLGLTNGNTVFATNTGFNLDSWFHVAIVRQSGVSKIYKNGISGGDTACTEDFSNSGSSNISIGWDSTIVSSEKYNGFISNLRVLKGTALYTGSFIPPSRELKKLPGTVLLCCKNSSDPTAEETGKTITANGDPAASNFTPQIGSDGSVTFDGVTKINTQNYFYLPTGNTENRGRGRGVFGGGYVPGTSQNTIQFINIQSSGSAIDFGDLSSNMGSADGKAPCAAASSTRALFASGYSAPAPINTIEFITIATTSNSTDFGDLLTSRRDLGACSSSTRALFGGGTTTGSTSATNVIEYVTIASLGNAVSFGTLTQARRGVSSCSSSTRGIFGGGYITASPTATFSNRIDFVTIATTGNATTFGDLTVIRGGSASCSSSVRGIFAGGTIYVAPASTFYNTIDYITIASTGNAQDFGDLTSTRNIIGSCSNSTRGVFGGGGNPTLINTMEFVSITSTGNVQDFGDLLSAALYYNGGCSDSHGGLS